MYQISLYSGIAANGTTALNSAKTDLANAIENMQVDTGTKD